MWDTPSPDLLEPWTSPDGGWSWTRSRPDDFDVRGTPHPCPALVTIGRHAGADVMLNLECCGALALVGSKDEVDDFVRHLSLELGASPFADAPTVLLVSDATTVAGEPEHVRLATVNGLLTGSVDIIYAANVTVGPLVESGKVRALAKLDRRSPTSMANIPTLADAAGLSNLDDMSVWLGLVAPKGTPRPIIDKLQRKIVQIMADPAMREKSERTGAYPMTSTPEEFAQFMRREADRWAPVLKETGIKFD